MVSSNLTRFTTIDLKQQTQPLINVEHLANRLAGQAFPAMSRKTAARPGESRAAILWNAFQAASTCRRRRRLQSKATRRTQPEIRVPVTAQAYPR